MSDRSPTHSRLIALKEERGAMQEGYVFLDEKCLLLAGEMLRQVERHDQLMARLAAAQRRAGTLLRAALARHGVQGLSVYPALPPESLSVREQKTALIGVVLRRAELLVAAHAPVAAVYPSPEAEACRSAFAELAQAAAALAASIGNLVRLEREYRRTVRRASSLHDVVLPELALEEASIGSELEELERDEGLWARIGRRER